MVRIDPPPEAIEADRLEQSAQAALNASKLALLRADWTRAREAAEAAARACRRLEEIDARAVAAKGG